MLFSFFCRKTLRLSTGTGNSAEGLQNKILEEHGVSYNLQTAFETGVDGLLSVGNAILSRWEVELSILENLPKTTELEWNGIRIKLRRNVLMLRLNIPNVDPIHVYNTHLCAACTIGEQEAQMDELLSDMKNTESSIAEENPIILGGDFKIDWYKTILKDHSNSALLSGQLRLEALSLSQISSFLFKHSWRINKYVFGIPDFTTRTW